MLTTLFHIAALHCIINQPYFLSSELITARQHNVASDKLEELVRGVAPQSLHLVDAFGLPTQVLRYAPASTYDDAHGWKSFNEHDNRGEVATRSKL